MTNGAVRRENLFAAIGLGKFLCLFTSGTTRPLLFLWDDGRIERIAAEVSRETAEIRATEKDREPVDRNQPDGKRLETGARFALFPLDRGMYLMDIRVFSIIHSLPHVAAGRMLVHFFSSFAGAGDDAGAGEEAGAEVSFASFSSCDWSSDIR